MFKKGNQSNIQIQINSESRVPPTNHTNYIAIVILEKLGLFSPSQQQIDIVESLVQMKLNKKHYKDDLELTSLK